MAKFLVQHFEPLGTRICEAAGIDPMVVSRVVLDLKIGSPGRIYVEMYADEEVLHVNLPDGFEISPVPNPATV